MSRPNLPSEKQEGNRGSLQIRFKAIQLTDTMYDVSSATVPRAVIWLKVIVEPMLINVKRMEITVVVRTAYSGMSQPSET